MKIPGVLKPPTDISFNDGRPFFSAGIRERATQIRPETYLHFTTAPNELMACIHNRMPAILSAPKEWRWLQRGPLSIEELRQLTTPHPADEMTARPISTLVNNACIDLPECIAGPDDSTDAVSPREMNGELDLEV